MESHAVPVAIMAGISAYAAVLFAGLYFSLARVANERTRREYLSFALTCVTVGAYDITCVGLYDASSIQEGAFWMRGNLLTASWFGLAYMRFAWDFLQRPMPRVLRLGAWVLAILGITVSVWESPLTFTTSHPAIKHVLAFGADIVYFEVEAGVVPQVLLLLFFAAYLVNGVYLYRYFRSKSGREQRGQLGFLIATALSGATATNDFLVTGGAYTFLYTFEYGVAAILMAMGYVLLMRFGALHEVVNTLNQDLSTANGDLVVALQQAQESSRTKTEFLASISHELRTPLNAIINLPEALLEQFATTRRARCTACGAEYELEADEQVGAGTKCEACSATALKEQSALAFVGDPDSAQACLRTVDGAARHLLGLVNDILDASKIELGRTVVVPSSFDPRELVRDVVDSAQALAGKSGIRLQFLHPENDVSGPIVADRVRIGQVLYNLISNAIKFSSAGDVVEVSLATRRDGGAEICVRDHGVGIDPEHHAIIFEKFRQIDGGATRVYGGTGLGLAISKGLVEMHGGRIWVESAKGQGASFFVHLPPRIAA